MNHRLALVKSISWRLSGIVILCVLLLISTGRVDISVLGTSVYSVIRTVQYYFHEWLWQVKLKNVRESKILDWIYRRLS